ncbi:MAG: DMT family transporter [Pseudomonadota bacterium]
MTKTASSDNIALAISAVLASVLALSLGDALIKAFSVQFSLSQLFVLRSMLVLALLWILGRATRQGLSINVGSAGWIVLRSVLLVTMWVAYYIALQRVPLSTAAAVFYTLPLFICLLAAIFLKEPIRKLGWVAIGIGFVGMLIIVRPETSGFNAYVLLPLISAICYAGAMVITRAHCQQCNPLGLSMALHLAFVLIGLLITLFSFADILPESVKSQHKFLFGQWSALTSGTSALMLALAGLIMIGSIGSAMAYQRAPASLVSIFDYGYLIGGVLWGFVFFHEIPDTATVIGMTFITLAGVVVIRYGQGEGN